MISLFGEELFAGVVRRFKIRDFLYDQPNRKEALLFRQCLLAARPFLRNFEMEVYPPDSSNPDIYILCESDSLFVPVKALLDGDWEAVENRMEELWKLYPASGEEMFIRRLATLASMTGLRLKHCMEKDDEDWVNALFPVKASA